MKTRLRNLWETLRSSYWFIPSVMLVGAAGLSLLTQYLDSKFQGDIAHAFPGVFKGGPDGARSMLATIAGSMITAASVTFSITIAALANASSQYGPRLLRIFMRDTGSQVVLGTFLGTFIYCILALRLVPASGNPDKTPHLSTTVALLLTIASIGVLIYFIHHMASMLQVSHVAARVGEELILSISTLFPEDLGADPADDDAGDAIPLDDAGSNIIPDRNRRVVMADRIGYIQAVDDERLMRIATQHDVVVRITLRPGAYVVPGAKLAAVWPSERATDELTAELQEIFLVGDRRTPYQDIELFFDELVEIALRALSPGINDPNTAITCIDWLTAGLASLASRRLPSRYRYAHDNALRVIADAPRLDQLIDLAFDQIRGAGAGHPVILRKLLEAAATIAPFLSTSAEREALQRQALAVDALSRSSDFAAHEKRGLADRYLATVRALNTAT